LACFVIKPQTSFSAELRFMLSNYQVRFLPQCVISQSRYHFPKYWRYKTALCAVLYLQ
jgi:hypothetical protein